MPLGDILKGLAGGAVKSTVQGTFREHKNNADYEKEIAAKMTSDDASYSAKEGGLTVDEAEDLIEKSRDSAVAEAQKRTNQEQHKMVLLLLLGLMAYAILVEPGP